MVTLGDVAALAGVSISAASRVLRNAPNSRVSDSTRSRITEAARVLEYRPNYAARALKYSRTNAVALIVPDLTNAIFTELMRGVDEQANDDGFMVLLARAERMHAGGEMVERLIGEGRVDGLLVQVGDAVTDADAESLLAGRLPMVLINSAQRGHAGSVALDDERAVAVAVSHLASLGHTRIGLINGLPPSDTSMRRGAGFIAAMTELDLPINEGWITNLGYEPENGRIALRTIMSRGEMPTAVVVANINSSFGVLIEARERGLDVPRNLSVVAIHDAWTAENSWPALTTVRMPLYELGRTSMRALHDRLSGGSPSEIKLVDPPPQLVTRQSTSVPGV